MDSTEPKVFSDAMVQTAIRVRPHLLEVDQTSRAVADRKSNTVLTIPSKEDDTFHNLLRFTPFSDIRENSVRIFDIARSKKLQINAIAASPEMEERAREFSLLDDDGLGYVCSSLIRRILLKRRPTFLDQSTQTEVTVGPHILEDNKVASIFISKQTQT